MAPPSLETETVVDPKIYGRSGNIDKHLEGVQKQYDTTEKREFYAQVMGDGECCVCLVDICIENCIKF